MKKTSNIFATFIVIISVFTLLMTNEQFVQKINIFAEEKEDTLVFQENKYLSTLQKDQLVIERVQEEEIIAYPRFEVRGYDGRAGLPWLASMTTYGSPSIESREYVVTKDYYGNEVVRTALTGTTIIEEGGPAILQYGSSVVEGATFDASMTTYGLDCVGCSSEGITASGVRVSLDEGVLVDGSWKEGITYKGYFIIAADSNIPMCSILEISNHGYTGYGLTPNVPFQAIVLDRGGAIKGPKLDLYKGSEKNFSLHVNHSLHQPKVEIKKVGNKQRNGCNV